MNASYYVTTQIKKRRRRVSAERLEKLREKILEELYNNGLTPLSAIASEGGYSHKLVKGEYDDFISRSTIRIRALRNIRVPINSENHGEDGPFLVYHLYKVAGSKIAMKDLATKLNKIKWIEEMVALHGTKDLLIKFHCNTRNHYHKLMEEEIQPLLKENGITESEGIIGYHIFKEQPKYEADFSS